MVSSLLKMGLRSIDTLAQSAAKGGVAGGQSSEARHHPLAAYPRLKVLLTEAERSGSLATERRRLMARRLSV